MLGCLYTPDTRLRLRAGDGEKGTRDNNAVSGTEGHSKVCCRELATAACTQKRSSLSSRPMHMFCSWCGIRRQLNSCLSNNGPPCRDAVPCTFYSSFPSTSRIAKWQTVVPSITYGPASARSVANGVLDRRGQGDIRWSRECSYLHTVGVGRGVQKGTFPPSLPLPRQNPADAHKQSFIDYR